MIKCTFIVFFIVVSCSAVFSQSSNSSSKDTVQNSLKKGSLSLQFGIAANLSLQAFNDYSISVKYHISPKSALRLGIGGDYTATTGTVEFDHLNRDLIESSYSYSFDLSYLFYFNPASTVNVFLGGGPLISFSFSNNKDPYGNYEIDTYESNSWGIGPKFVVGGEWFFLKKLSLFAEYEAYYNFGKSKSKSTSLILSTGEYHYENVEQNVISFKGNTARLGLSIYF